MRDVVKEKLNSLVGEYRRINSKPNKFYSIEYLYTVSFCETRKTNSNAIRVLFVLLNFWKSRKCALK